MAPSLQIVDQNRVARITLNRPDVHNAFDDELIGELTATLVRVDADPTLRAVVLSGAGASFSAGANLNWMRGMAKAGEAENRADSERLALLMRTLNFLSKPTIARVNGAAYGGGVGLIACCDIAIAADTAKFGLT
jgi:methylglutaconyl-CoA hydratase